tara:strand:- start:3660 stop:5672 length:2013 start_codon:yes stop_codon:yes gene_type:complete
MNAIGQNHLQYTAEHPLGEPISFTSDGEVNSRRYSELWDFSGVEARGYGKMSTVSFISTSPSYRKTIQDTLFGLYYFYKRKYAQAPTSIQLDSWKSGLQHIANILGSTEWTEIDTDQGFRSFKLKLKSMQLGIPTIQGKVVNVLNKLFEGGVVTRIVNGRVLAALGANKAAEQHIAVPIGMYQNLLSQVILKVETYHPHRESIARVQREADAIKARVRNGENLLIGHKGKSNSDVLSMGHGAIERRSQTARQKLIKHDIHDFNVGTITQELSVLKSSCAIVLLAFSGARVGEMVSFGKDSYDIIKTDSGKEISVLHGETSKGNDGKPLATTWQTHMIAKDALELVYDMTEPLRESYKVKIEVMLKNGELNFDQYQKAKKDVKSAFIPLKFGMQKRTFVSTAFSGEFNRLMKLFDIRATEKDVDEFDLLNPSREGTLKVGSYLPKLTPHDFRRSFAVFFKRYGFGNASGIKFQYKHHNINMSDYYAKNAELMSMHDVLMDKNLLQIMEEEGISLGVDIYDDIYNGSKNLSGVGGERIAQDKFKKMKTGHEVYMSRADIESLVRNGSLAIVQLPTGGYCTNSKCERICGMRLFIGEKKQCIHSVNTDKTAKEMARQRNRLIGKFQGLNSGDTMMNSILVGIKQKIKEIEIVLVKHEVKYDAFEDKVRGLINV